MQSLRSQGNSFCANDLHYCIILQSLLDRLLSICGTPFRSARRPTPIPLPLHVVGLLTLRAGRRVAAGSHPHTLPTIVLVRSFHPPTSPPECRWRHGCDADACCRCDACCKADTCKEADGIGDADSDADAECVAKASCCCDADHRHCCCCCCGCGGGDSDADNDADCQRVPVLS